MSFPIINTIKFFAVAILLAVAVIRLRKRLSKTGVLILTAAFAWIGVFASFLSGVTPPLKEQIKLTAMGTKNELSQWNQIMLSGYQIQNNPDGFFYTLDGKWLDLEKGENSNESFLIWVPPEDNLWETGITDSITLDIPVGTERSLLFISNQYGGQVLMEFNGVSAVIDTFSPQDTILTYPLESSQQEILLKNELKNLPWFAGIFIVLAGAVFAAILFLTRMKQIEKIKRLQFLFQELIKRDFTLKYKRTMLGMIWSVISPLINLLILWLVFNQLLGSAMEHYVIYLFSGQLVFSYFSDATTLGMTSLLDNAPIFTKVNVSKYLFLFSKNISALINFGLTLAIFFLFVAIDGIPFQWNFLLLIYPVLCLIIFNVGIGMILSAMFVFFRDIQYLWGIFTQLIMWLSAIFYSISGFAYSIQGVFLANPVYLFIRYFRKIIIENSVPALEFHLLMSAYSLVALGAGCWIYKKYNHEFLYYV